MIVAKESAVHEQRTIDDGDSRGVGRDGWDCSAIHSTTAQFIAVEVQAVHAVAVDSTQLRLDQHLRHGCCILGIRSALPSSEKANW